MTLPALVASWSQSRIPSDEEIVRRVLLGEPALFEVLMRRNNQRLYRAVRSVIRNEAAVEDVMQQTYLAAFGALGSFEHTSRFSTWLVRIGLNEALAARRRASRLSRVPDDAGLDEEDPVDRLPSNHPSPEDRAGARELGRLLEHVLDGVSQTYRTVVMLRQVEGLSTGETAEVLGVSEDVVKTRLRRARLLLRERLYASAERLGEQSFPFHASRCDRVVFAVLERLPR
ncbi:MAG TPA: RNA polymerase sigma factor [Myxococcaceae bacterium]|jgi:RNA polymerase sigma-70 factor (ECF subfamily)|nr:RNA polymerase sigma factor [Myxococcaceae bacterium]